MKPLREKLSRGWSEVKGLWHRLPGVVRNVLITAVVLGLALPVSHTFRNEFGLEGQVSDVFVFAVFLISLWTDGYVYGIVAAFLSMLVVTYGIDLPFMEIDFALNLKKNSVSAVVLIVMAVSTSALTSKLKIQEVLKAESQRERMRANLLRAVSHDLRTPLTTIYGASATLLENRETLNEQQKVEILEGIQEDAQWLVRMVENLLSVTRIDAEKVKLNMEPTVLEELIDAVVRKFRQRFPSQDITINLPEELVIIPMDVILMEQVIHNILENAVYHAKNMTKLELQVRLREGKAIFEIRDNGCGIDKERMEHLFSGDYFAEDTEHADRQRRNAGIGLSVCATIVKAHGGVITAENRRGGGATFRFSLNTEDTEDE